ncbi:1,4-dihydroxy-6-naphthoate synthase [Nostoc ellipsosporum NOK]|nr:1,4-dihydroxy-6-naphthoate synthase [Nostoc ellipsosporum NOK]
MKLTLGFSPCPNDTFIFDALVNGHIDTGGFTFDVVLEDVETLNQWTLEGKLDITKLSFPAFFQSTSRYALLSSGSALGKGVGPLLISRNAGPYTTEQVNDAQIILPGVHTTAHLLFGYAYPGDVKKKFGLFSSIEEAVLNGDADMGVIIHENRFTYQQRGLHKVADLGEYWERQTGVPIPLGGIAAKRDLPEGVAAKVASLIRESLQYSFDRYPKVSAYVKAHAQAMEENVMRQHIDLYVNNYSLDLGDDGRQAIDTLHQVFLRREGQQRPAEGLFI